MKQRDGGGERSQRDGGSLLVGDGRRQGEDSIRGCNGILGKGAVRRHHDVECSGPVTLGEAEDIVANGLNCAGDIIACIGVVARWKPARQFPVLRVGSWQPCQLDLKMTTSRSLSSERKDGQRTCNDDFD